MSTEDKGVVSGIWSRLDANRQNHLSRCRKCSALTIPSLLPPEGDNEDVQLPTPYQSLGARAVNNLASKLMLTLFPPNSPFFRYDVEPAVMEELKAQYGEEGFKTKVRKRLAMVEVNATTHFEMMAYRVPLYRALRLLIVTGNGLLEVPKEGRMKVHRLDKFVVRRSPSGRVIEIIIKEGITREELPEGIEEERPENETDPTKNKEKVIDLFTHCHWKQGKWNVAQEVLGQTVPGSEGTYVKEDFPYIPLVWMLADGEDYGRGQVEEYLGDFISLDGLNRHLLEGAAAAAKVVMLVNPNGTTNIRDLQNALNGDYVVGTADDVTVLQIEKFHDFKIAYDQAQTVDQRLSRAFLLNESIQRNAERVTAEEIRYMAQELNDAVGGIYSLLSLELQLPLVNILMSKLTKSKKLPSLPDGVHPTIITGFDALGRGHDLQKLITGLQYLEPLGPDVMQTYMVINDYIDRVFTALGVDTDGLIRSEEEVKKLQEQNQMQSIMERLGPNIINQLGGQKNAQS